jgi:hypothetical protein
VLRLFSGLFAVRNYRKTSEPVEDKELLELLDLVGAELGCLRSVEIRESKSVSSPATVGWHKPIVLLPREWREWSTSEQRAVLAHEVAHIRRFDFPAWIVAQLGVVLHFYNPIVHWLAQRLRLEQELAADAAAAEVVGGNTVYLQTLAGMAIRQDDRRLSWAARTFLPSHHTFLRRIEMLRRRSPLAARLTVVGRTLIACSLLGAAVFAAGLRSPFEEESVAQDSPATPKTESKTTGFSSADGTTGAGSAPVSNGESLSLTYVPRDALIVGAIRPAEVLSQPAFAPLKKAVEMQEGMQEMFGFSVMDVQQATAVFLPKETRHGTVQPDEGGFVIVLKKPIEQEHLLKKWLRTPETAEFAGQTYYKTQFRAQHIFFPNDRTIVLTKSEEKMRRFIIAGERGAANANWADAWKQVSNSHAAMMMDLERVRPGLNAELQRGPAAAIMGPFAPLWNNGVHAVGGVTAGSELDLKVSVVCDGEKGAASVEETVKAMIVLSRNSLSSLRAQMSRQNNEEAAMALKAADMVDEVFDHLKIETNENVVTATAKIGDGAGEMIALLVPAVTQARVAAKRSQSMNNMKQIGLAMHNYHEVHGHLPPAVVIGPDGKTPHSWRVAILPFIEGAELYQAYRMDEPWDSEHNKKLLEQIPGVYRSPSDDEFSTNTSYFVFVGKGTAFESQTGNKFSEFTDGTSNTLMAVETKKEVPWTKPEDLPFDPAKDVAELGGFYPEGFNALISDGSVKFISESLDEKILKLLIQRNDGQPIPNQ